MEFHLLNDLLIMVGMLTLINHILRIPRKFVQQM